MTDHSLTRNPVTHKKSKRERFWQILFPIGLCALIVVTLVVLLLIGRHYSEAAVLADYFAVLMLLFLIISSLPLLLLIVWLSGLVGRGVTSLPATTFKGQNFFNRQRSKIDEFTDKIAKKIIQTRSLRVGLDKALGLNQGKMDIEDSHRERDAE